MSYLELIPDAIPATLRALPFVLWRAEPRAGDKPAKVPYRIADPDRRASSTDPATWGPFADAVEAYGALAGLAGHPVRGPVAGIGVVLTAEHRVACLDLDHVLDAAGGLDPAAERIVGRCASWTEVSPSGTGLHVFVRGHVAQAIRGHQIEVYSVARFIALTGHQWPGTPSDVRDAQPYLDVLAQLARPACPRGAYTGPAMPPPDDLAGALLARLHQWGIPGTRIKQWTDGYLVELDECPWADEHTAGRAGAAVMIRASGAFDFTCLHAHCAGRTWRDFRAAVEPQAHR